MSKNRSLETKLFMLQHLDHDCCFGATLGFNFNRETRFKNNGLYTCECDCLPKNRSPFNLEYTKAPTHSKICSYKMINSQQNTAIGNDPYNIKTIKYSQIGKGKNVNKENNKSLLNPQAKKAKVKTNISKLIRRDLLKQSLCESESSLKKYNLHKRIENEKNNFKENINANKESFRNLTITDRLEKESSYNDTSIILTNENNSIVNNTIVKSERRQPRNFQIMPVFMYQQSKDEGDDLQKFVEAYTPRSKGEPAHSSIDVLDTFDMPGPLLTFKKQPLNNTRIEAKNECILPNNTDIESNSDLNNLKSSNIFTKKYEEDNDSKIIENNKKTENNMDAKIQTPLKPILIKNNLRTSPYKVQQETKEKKQSNSKPKKRIKFIIVDNKDENLKMRSANKETEQNRKNSRSTSFLRSRNNSVDCEKTVQKSMYEKPKKIDFYVPDDNKIKGGFISKIPRNLHSPVNFDINAVPKLKKTNIQNSFKII